MATKTDIANRALERAGVKAPDETATDADIASVLSSLTDLHETMVDDRVVRFELSAIPSRAVGPLTDELAFYIRDDFNLPIERTNSLAVRQQEARQALERQSEIPHDGEPVRAQYY